MEVTLTAEPRSGRGKGPARQARARGIVPAVLYGHAVDSTPIAVDAKQMFSALHTEAGANVLIHLKLDGQEYLTMAREIQRNPIRGNLIHIDFVALEKDVKIEADIPVHLAGESRGIKEGGQLDQHIYEIKILALPTNLPPAIEVDIADLGIGDVIRISELASLPGAEILNDPEEVVVGVVEQVELKVEEEVPEVEALEGEAAPEGEATVEGAEGAEGAEGSE